MKMGFCYFLYVLSNSEITYPKIKTTPLQNKIPEFFRSDAQDTNNMCSHSLKIKLNKEGKNKARKEGRRKYK